MCDLLQVGLFLFVAKFAIGDDYFDILEDDREASNPVPSMGSALIKNVV